LTGRDSTSLLLVAQHVSGNHVLNIRISRLPDFIACVGMCRGCGKVIKTVWKVVLPLHFY